ncbi:NACHT domain-containing protein [Kribbella sp. NBC_01245]|uniref:NACHT domain-containing protein n=1 Tax=Kribbella sp. NBC_01245 TaxID=2903578 RepID=UPI002E28A4DA|nr:NACHT domain-containing protein [Kribbella sp. NBC_01245]
MAVALLSLGLFALVIRGLDRGWLNNTAAILALVFAFAAASIQLLSLRRMSHAETTSTLERVYLAEVIRRFGPNTRTSNRRPVELEVRGTGEPLTEGALAARLVAPGVRVAVLVAPRGGGKTSLLRHLVAVLAADRQHGTAGSRLPMLVWTRDWSIEGQTLTEFLARESGVPADVIERWAANGSLLVMVDGLDELEPIERSAAMRQVLRFRETYPDAKVLLSDQRPVNLQPDLVVEIKAISPAEVEDWLTNLAPGTVQQWPGVAVGGPLRMPTDDEEADESPYSPQEIQYEAAYRRAPLLPPGRDLELLLAVGDGQGVVDRFERWLAGRSPEMVVALARQLIPVLLERGDVSAAAKVQHLAMGIFKEPSEQTQLPTVDDLSADEKRVYAVLRVSVAQDLAQVASGAGLRPSATDRALQSLVQAGLATVSGDRYRLTLESGR